MNEEINRFKHDMAKAINALRTDFVNNEDYRGLDLDFLSVLEMVLDISRKSATKLNEIALLN